MSIHIVFRLVLLLTVVAVAACGGTSENTREASAKLVCDQTDSLRRGVLYETLTIEEIKRDIDEIAVSLDGTNDPMRGAAKKFVRVAKEIVAEGGYFDYPTFQALDYLDTLELMGLHAHAYLALNGVAALCDWDALSPPADVVSVPTPAYVAEDPQEPQLPEGALITNAKEAHQTVNSFLHEKSWGFFGATCEAWLTMDYELDSSGTLYSNDEGRWVVRFIRAEGRYLGPKSLAYRVHPGTAEVKGDNETPGRLGKPEGCNRW